VLCPYCNRDNDKVIDSRAAESGGTIRRRRECLECGKRFTTYERVEKTARLVVVKKDGSRVPFDLESVLRGIQAACGKRPIPEELKERIASAVDDEVHRDFEREVPSSEIGRRVARRLRDIDQVAYVRFASVYHDFRTIEEFQSEISDLTSRPKTLPNEQPLFDAPDGTARRSE
jgi:transcriptional repressor NrdR